jgi:histidinol-phosphate aminotransferase
MQQQKEEIMVPYWINDHIRDYQLKDYGKGGAPAGTLLDCSLGVNPEDIPAGVMAALGNISMGTLKHYPHDESVLDAIAKYYANKSKGLSWLTKEYMYLGDGTTDILHNLNVLFLKYGAKAYGHAPQFTAYIDQVNCLGAIYESYKMDKKGNYKFVTEDYISHISSAHSLFIVENPNNPTGQIIDIQDIEKLIDRARSRRRILIVDEAYGDYMPIENSAINLVPKYSNVVVTRSFSKGFGMAGMRLGYLITSNEEVVDTLTQFKKIGNQFNCNSIARILGIAFLQSGAVIPDLNQVSKNKKDVIDVIDLNKLHIATTAPATPIMTLYLDKPIRGYESLQDFLSKTVHLWTVSCATFDGLDKWAVRLMLPVTGDIGTLKQMLMAAQAQL